MFGRGGVRFLSPIAGCTFVYTKVFLPFTKGIIQPSATPGWRPSNHGRNSKKNTMETPLNTKKKYPGFFFRCTEAEKARYQALAKSQGMELSKLIRHRLAGDQPLKDYTREAAFFQQLNLLTREMSYIGHNINQVTTALHQINNSQKIEAGEFALILSELKRYNDLRDQLSYQLQKAFF